MMEDVVKIAADRLWKALYNCLSLKIWQNCLWNREILFG